MYQDKDAYLQLWQLTKMVSKYGLQLRKNTTMDLLKELTKRKNVTKQGKAAIEKLVKDDKPLSMTKIKKEDMGKFKEQAKKLGLTFVSMKDTISDKVTVLFKEKEKEKVAVMVDKMEERANKKDEKEEKMIYDLMTNLNFRKVDDNVYKQQQIMSAEQVASMKQELEKKGVKSDVVVTEVIDDHRYRVEFRVAPKDKEKVKKPLSQLIDNAIEKSKTAEIGEKVKEKVRGVMERGCCKIG